MKTALLLLSLLVIGSLVPACKKSDGTGTSSESAKSYTTAGVIKSFGENRAYANITHDDIPGYMKSMTMSFEPRTPDQLKDLKEGDRVKFTFSDADGKRLLDKIEK